MTRPNIALIVLDSFRYDRLWADAPGGRLCPHLAEFAERAASFENAIAPAALTGPAHAALFTGRLPADAGAFSLARLTGGRLSGPVLAGLLRAAGYLCVAVSANPWITHRTALGRDFDILISSSMLADPRPPVVEEGLLRKIRRKARVLGRSMLPASTRPAMEPSCRNLLLQAQRTVPAVSTVLRTLHARWPDRPVFLFCNLMVTHDPYLFEPDDADFTRPEDAPEGRILPRRAQRDYWLDLLGVEPVSPAKLARIRWSYDASVRYADRLAGRMVAAVDEHLGPEPADIILTADHGELLGEHGFFDHGVFLYEPLVHVPLLVRSPGLGQGVRVGRTVQTHWVWSLIMQRAGLLAEADVPAGQGSLRDAASGGGADMPAYSFSDPEAELKRLTVAITAAAWCGVDAARVNPKPMDVHVQAVRLGQAALIRTSSGRTVAYRIADGTVEQELSGPEAEDVRGALEPRLLDMRADAPAAVERAATVDEEVMRRLRDLGYTD